MVRLTRRQFTAALAAGSVGLAGCGGDTGSVAKTSTTLRGRLTAGRRQITTGTVTIHKDGAQVMQTSVNPDGSFEFFNLPTGDYQLTVTDTESDTPYGKGVKLNAKYADPSKSGLSVGVTGNDESPREINLDAAK